MKSLGFKKKNLIALAVAAVLAVTGVGTYNVHAAKLIDESQQCKITVRIPDTCAVGEKPTAGTTSNSICLYNGDLKIDLYQIAEVETNGDIGTTLANVDLSALSKSDVTADTIKSIANSAYEVVKDSEPNYTITLNPSKEKTKTIDVNKGIYLYVPHDCQNGRYTFKSDKYIVMVPYSTTISEETKVDANGEIVKVAGSDEWIYDAEIALKFDATEVFGSLTIQKTLTKYNKSLGTTPFVFEVEATYGEGDEKVVVYSNVFSMDFSKPGSQEITVEKIPANSTVTVTEVYSGASYKLTSDKTKTTTIVENKTSTVKFINDYDDQTDIGTISIENHFDKNGFVDSTKSSTSSTTDKTTDSTSTQDTTTTN